MRIMLDTNVLISMILFPNASLIENIDVFITGDKDFAEVDPEMPVILTPAAFMEKYNLS